MTERRIFLVRHGQYDDREDVVGVPYRLTDMGRAQADWVRRRFMSTKFDSVTSSTMIRAIETAHIAMAGKEFKRTRLLSECMPTPVKGFRVDRDEARENQARLDRAYEKFFKPTRKPRSDLLVCHGNVIRYFVCRAMEVKRSSWIRLAIHHCSVTEIRVRPSGRSVVVAYNETGHLPERMRTMSNPAAGLKMKVVPSRKY